MNNLRSHSEPDTVDAGFAALSALAYQEAGLVLSEKKSAMIRSRLRHRLQALNLDSLEEYCTFVQSGNSNGERQQMISALTTNVTDFFRERHHFEYIEDKLVSRLAEKLRRGNRVRIWSAGCSRGQEPYSVAMFLFAQDPVFATADCKILATDIDHEVLAFAQQGTYQRGQLSNLSEEQIERFFVSESAQKRDHFTVKKEIKDMVSFRELNLLNEWPMRGKFDIIFCRNVVIYFDYETQSTLWPKFAAKLEPDGTIFVGHSERINSEKFVTCGATTYALSGDKKRTEIISKKLRAENGIA